MTVSGGILESACLSVSVSVDVQNTTFCQSPDEGIKSHSLKALVYCLLRIILNSVVVQYLITSVGVEKANCLFK